MLSYLLARFDDISSNFFSSEGKIVMVSLEDLILSLVMMLAFFLPKAYSNAVKATFDHQTEVKVPNSTSVRPQQLVCPANLGRR